MYSLYDSGTGPPREVPEFNKRLFTIECIDHKIFYNVEDLEHLSFLTLNYKTGNILI